MFVERAEKNRNSRILMKVAEKTTRERSIMMYGAERLELPAVSMSGEIKSSQLSGNWVDDNSHPS